jgi:nicotinamide phosphoribosyltransferase
MSDYNIILDTDSYKVSHWVQYPANTTSMFSYIESRGGRYDKTVFFGLQYIIDRYLTKPISQEDIDEAAEFYEAHGVPFNREGWEHILNEHFGFVPVRIRAVPEGSVIPVSNVLVTIESTDPKCFWVVSWLETMLVRIWHPINVATIGYHTKKDIMHYLELTSDDPEAEIPFKLHDFGSRGVSSQESAAIGGAAHMVNFMGSDTVVGVMTANKYYDHPMSGFSIPASEHSTMTSWGREHEVEAFANMLTQYAKPGALVACVSDSYDIYNACEKLWGEELKQWVIDSGVTLVIRPDSGDPLLVVLECLRILDEKFGHTLNSKGFKVLNHVRVIQGDGIGPKDILVILANMYSLGWSATNIAFGMGGGLLQRHNRDTQKFAMKCSSITVDGEERDVWKDPVDDKGKASKRGRLDMERWPGGYATVILPAGMIEHPNSFLHTVYEDGGCPVTARQTLEVIRKRTK